MYKKQISQHSNHDKRHSISKIKRFFCLQIYFVYSFSVVQWHHFGLAYSRRFACCLWYQATGRMTGASSCCGTLPDLQGRVPPRSAPRSGTRCRTPYRLFSSSARAGLMGYWKSHRGNRALNQAGPTPLETLMPPSQAPLDRPRATGVATMPHAPLTTAHWSTNCPRSPIHAKKVSPLPRPQTARNMDKPCPLTATRPSTRTSSWAAGSGPLPAVRSRLGAGPPISTTT